MTIGRIPSVEGGIQPTIVDAKGDLIAATAADTVNRLAVGSNDQVLVADSSASTGLAWKSYGAQTVAGKNAAINGACEIAQRGTAAVTLTAANFVYPIDRWFAARPSGTSGATAQQISSIGLDGFQYALRLQRTSGNTSTTDLYLGQTLESANSIPFANKAVTISFWARAGSNYSGASNAFVARLYSGTGTDQSAYGFNFTGSATPINGTATLTTSWQRFQFTGTVASTATQLQFFAYYTPNGTAGTNDYVDITGIQVEAGSTATPFSRAAGTLQGELAACQRYYLRNSASTTFTTLVPTAYAYDATTVIGNLPLPVTMRTNSTVVEFGNIAFYRYDDTGYAITAVTINGNQSGNQVARFVCTVTGATAGNVGAILANNNSAGYIAISAEL